MKRIVFAVALLALGALPLFAAPNRDVLKITALEDRRESGEKLFRFLGNGDADVRARAALAVGRVGNSDDVAALARLLTDESVTVRRNAAFALGEIPDSTASVPLATLLTERTEVDAEVRTPHPRR